MTESNNILTQVTDAIPWAYTTTGTGITTGSVPAATVLEPMRQTAGRAIFDVCAGPYGVAGQNLYKCLPIATGGNNTGLTSLEVYGWTFTPGKQGVYQAQWEPWFLFSLSMTCGNLPGPALSQFAATWFRMDTLTFLTPAAAPNWAEVISPSLVTADRPGWFTFDAMGYRKIEAVPTLNDATAWNGLVSGF